MKKKSRRQKNDELRRRYDAIKNLMSTFAMSTVAVVAVVTMIPASANAEITKTVALSEEIVYQVNVTDEDNSLDIESLTVVLENQLEYYEQPIILGETSGYFDELVFNTEYRLSVYGDKGFGSERLDTKIITTKEKVGGTILGVTPSPDIHSTIYTIDVSIFDPDSKYSSINLYYGYSWEPDVDFIYSSIPITTDKETIELFDIFTTYPFHIYLEGTTSTGVEILDEIWVTPPFVLFADIYLAYLNNDEVAFHAYGNSEVENLEYKMNVYRNEYLLKSDMFTPSSDYHSNSKWVIEDLMPDTTYIFECIAIYKNPQTLRTEEVIVYSQELTTVKDFSFTHSIINFDTYLEITVILDDPEDSLTNVLFEVMDTSGEFDVYINGESYVFISDGEYKTYTFTIDLPNVEEYEIYIGMNSNVNSNIRQKIVEIIESREE